MKYLIISAIILHVATRTFWDYGVDYSYRDRFERAMRSEDFKEVKLAYEGIERQETPAQNRYSLGISAVILLWVIAIQYRIKLSDTMLVIMEWWSFWVVSDVVKEMANLFGVLQWLFNNPTQKYLSEYIIFFLSGGWVWWKLRKIKSSVHKSNNPLD